MKRLLLAAPVDIYLLYLLYIGFIEGVVWAKNVMLFVMWALALLSCLLLHKEHYKKVKSIHLGLGKRPTVFKWWDVATDIIYIGMVVAAGYFVLGVVLLVGVLSKQALAFEVDEELTQGQTK